MKPAYDASALLLSAIITRLLRLAPSDGETATVVPGLTLLRANRPTLVQSIQALAKYSSMSTSSLHHKFKATVMMGPLQYQKRLRLEEARRLLLSGLADATGAAFDVGDESPSPFTREYHRLFGLPPLRDVKQRRSDARGGAMAECS